MKVLVSTLIFVSAILSFSQPPEIEWSRSYGGNQEDRARSIQTTQDGGYIVAGWTLSFGNGGKDFYVVKLDSNGDSLWSRTYGGSMEEKAYSIQEKNDGGYLIAGYSRSFGSGDKDVYVVSTNSMGDTIWTRTYGGVSDDVAHSIALTDNNGFIFAGSTWYGSSSSDMYIVRADSLGDTLWTYLYGGFYLDIAYSIKRTQDDGYIIAGQCDGFGWLGTACLIKLGDNGEILWETAAFEGERSVFYDIEQTTDGGYIAVGENGHIEMGGPFWDYYYTYLFVMGANSGGFEVWCYYPSSGRARIGRAVQLLSNGDCIIAGGEGSNQGYNSPPGMNDVYLCRMGSFGGSPLWGEVYGYRQAYSVIICPSDSGYVYAGYDAESNGNMLIGKTEPDLYSGVFPVRLIDVPERFALYTPFPNPFNLTTAIKYSVTQTEEAKLMVYNVEGRRVRALVDETMAPGRYTKVFDGRDDYGNPLGSGVYFVQMVAGDFQQVRKVVLLK